MGKLRLYPVTLGMFLRLFFLWSRGSHSFTFRKARLVNYLGLTPFRGTEGKTLKGNICLGCLFLELRCKCQWQGLSMGCPVPFLSLLLVCDASRKRDSPALTIRTLGSELVTSTVDIALHYVHCPLFSWLLVLKFTPSFLAFPFPWSFMISTNFVAMALNP